MKCKEARRVLSRYLDDELPSTQVASIEEHLAQCPECRAEHATQQRLWTLLGRAEPMVAPNLIVAIEALIEERRGRASLFAGLRLRSLCYATATAALVGLFIWTGAWAGTERHRIAPSPPDRAFVELLSDVPPGMEVVALVDQIGE